MGIISLIVSISLMVVTFQKGASIALKRLLEEGPKPRWQAFIQLFYFVVFWLVYISGWITGLSNMAANSFEFQIAFWVGFVWFIIIPIAIIRQIYSPRAEM